MSDAQNDYLKQLKKALKTRGLTIDWLDTSPPILSLMLTQELFLEAGFKSDTNLFVGLKITAQTAQRTQRLFEWLYHKRIAIEKNLAMPLHWQYTAGQTQAFISADKSAKYLSQKAAQYRSWQVGKICDMREVLLSFQPR